MSKWKFTGNTTNPGNPLWNEYVDEETGRSSLQEHQKKKISEWDICKHYWELIDSNGNIQCLKCGLGKRIAWGIEFVKKGKIVSRL